MERSVGSETHEIAGRTPSPEAAAEQPLVHRLKAGEDAAYADLVAAHSGRMLAVAARICPEEAEDVLQEAFISAFKAMPKFDGRSLLGTWLHRITVNAALMRRRSRSRRREVDVEGLMPRFRGGFFEATPEPVPEPVTAGGLLDIEQKKAVWAAIERLPEDYRTVVVLRDMEGLSSSAVAASLGVSDALVRQRLHRARLALTKLLAASEFAGAGAS